MRLTLRTMLAFLDDVLEGPDARELEQKIDESKFASDLVHRIRGSVRRLRLGAPKLNGKGMGADANTVAEYLDNTMPPERVPDFEKVCLESDVQLAEVAACHQVLTIVLGEPAAVDPSIRDRMYRIGHMDTTNHPPASHDGNGMNAPLRAASAEAAAGKAVHTATESHRVQPARPQRSAKPAKAAREVRESAFPLKSLAITLLLFFIVTGVALRAIAPIDSKHPLWILFTGADRSTQVAQPNASGSSQDEPPQPVTETDAAGSLPSQKNVAASENATARKTEESSAKQPDSTSSAATEASAGPASNSGAPSESSATLPPVPPAVAGVEAPMPSAASATTEPATTTVPAPTAGVPAAKTGVPATGKVVPLPPPVEPIPSVRPTEAASAPINVGRYISEGQILARMDMDKNAWMVLPPDSSLNAGERLLSLPTYRPQIVVAPSVKLTVAGEAFLKLQAPDAGDLPRLSLDFGRILLVPVGEMGTSVQLDLGGRVGQLTFDDVESMAAIEVRPYLPVGADPMTVAPHLMVQIWAISGGTRWAETDRPAVPLTAGQSLQLMDEEMGSVLDGSTIPEWVDGENLQDLDRRASQELRKFLTTDRPLVIPLMEKTDYRQVEVRALSCRCLCYLDIFEPAISKLGDTENHSTWMWSPLIAAIQSTLPFGPETVAKLRADIEKLHGKDAEKVFRLLLGYSPEQLAAGGAAELVESLASESMAIRVLAFMTLKGITGKTLLYHPEERPEKEKSKIAQWQKLLQDGLIVYKNPPTPFPPTVQPPPGGPAK